MERVLENSWEKEAWNIEECVVGIDEAGRGPIAGPLVVAGVVFPPFYENNEIYDSKKLSEKKREQLYQVIMEEALEFQIKVVSEKEVDEYNIYRATQLAMHTIAESLSAHIVVTDAMPLPDCSKMVYPVVKGDQKSISVAAASILAKVTRDHIMVELDKLYPEYGFAKHKGYPTKAHLEALEKYGVLDCHRKSYGPVAKMNQMKLEL